MDDLSMAFYLLKEQGVSFTSPLYRKIFNRSYILFGHYYKIKPNTATLARNYSQIDMNLRCPVTIVHHNEGDVGLTASNNSFIQEYTKKGRHFWLK